LTVLARVAMHRHALRVALVALALALLSYGLLSRAATARRRAPALPTTELRGSPVTLAALRGRPAVVVFFASWCPDCKHEAAAVERFARSATGRGRVVAIDYDDGGDWRGFLQRYGWSFPVLSDSSGQTGAAFRIPFLPTVVFLDAEGRIVSTSSVTQTVASLEHGIASAA
jgi:cytochrome c biogenesis protein CcmG, thiol:disulfide interchange protein DsbE